MARTIVWSKVHLGAVNLWLARDEFKRDGDAPLAPPEHIGDDGRLKHECATQPSYAHVYDYSDKRGVWRYGRKVGELEDIKEGWLFQ